MTELLADRKEQNVVLGFHPNNIRRVGKADLRTDAACMECKAERAHRNIGKSLQTVLSPLAFAAYECAPRVPRNVPETLVLSGIQGGGGGKTKKPRPKRL